jgi:MFS superfamily sulfate permease-like transporter
LGLVHQVDHILRYDHSGWPFRPEVSLFTFSWVFFALGLAPLVMSRPWLRLVPVTLLLMGVQAAHILIETPHDQYSVWATGVSHDPASMGEPNLLGITSAPLGLLAAGVALALSAVFLAALVSLTVDARRPTSSTAV